MVSRDLLDAVRPVDLAAYLRAQGWRKVEERAERVAWWRSPDDEEVIVPLSKALGDYFLRLSDTINYLSEVGRKTPQQVVADIRSRFEDVFRTRLQRADSGDGTVPLQQGAEAIARIADLFEAAAVTTLRVMPSYRHVPDEARAFLSGARLGQTEVGSYVVTVHSRLPEQTDFQHPVSFQRKVLVNLASALDAARAAVVSPDREQAFRTSVERGVSSELCQALFELGTSTGVASLEFSLNWATAEPAPREVPREVRFTALAFPVLREAARFLRKAEPEVEFTLVGHVRRLENRDPTLLDELGQVAIVGDVHGQERTVSVRLKTADYIDAIHAHEQGRLVSVVGTLRVWEGERERYRLEDPSHFKVLN